MQHYFALAFLFLMCNILASYGILRHTSGWGLNRHNHKHEQGQKPQGNFLGRLHKGDHKCGPEYTDFCQNGGDCELLRDAKIPHCHCLPGYRGKQCENKNPQITTTTTRTIEPLDLEDAQLPDAEPIIEPFEAFQPPILDD